MTEIVGNFAFGDCYSLTGIVWPNNLESINGGRIEDGKYSSSAFSGCKGLLFATTKDVYNAAKVSGTTDSLNEVRFPESLKVIGGQTFANSFVPGRNTPVTIPASVEYVGSEAFCNKDGGTTSFSQIVVQRSSTAEGAMGDSFNGVTGYENNAFRWTGNACDRVVIFPDEDTKDSYLSIYHGFNDLKSSFTYELTLSFMNGKDSATTQQKLYGLAVSYEKDDESGVWSINPDYELPELPEGADSAQGDCWKMAGEKMDSDTLVTENVATFYDSNDPVVSFIVKFTPKTGPQYKKTYYPGDIVEVDLSTVVRADISVTITHPQYDPSKDDPWFGSHVYMRCQWIDPVEDEDTMAGDDLFKDEWKYGDRNTSLKIDKSSQSRLNEDALKLKVRGLQSGYYGTENPGSDELLFGSDKYTLQIKVIDPKPILDLLVVPTTDGKSKLKNEYLDFLPENSSSVVDHMNKIYDHAVAKDEDYNSLNPSPKTSWSVSDDASFNIAPGASNELTWTVAEHIFKDAGWVVPPGFSLSGTVTVYNPFVIDASAGEGGKIEPQSKVVAPYGSTKEFSIEADEGYTIESIWVDDDALNLSTLGGATEAKALYAFKDVKANHTIRASFKKDADSSHIITATAGTGGTISPKGQVMVDDGGSQTFAITPNSGYEIADVLVDGSSVSAVSTYTFDKVTANHTISATFKSTGSVTPPPVSQKVKLTYVENGGSPLEDVTVSKGTSVALATPVREGYTFEGWFYDADLTDLAGMGGTRITLYANTTVYAKWSQSEAPGSFVTDHINYIMGRETEDGDRLIAPLSDVTRAEVATMVFRLLKPELREANLTDESSFADVSSDAWYAEPVATLAAMGAIKGYPQDGLFHPDDPITRAELVTIVTRLDERFDEGEWYGDLPFDDVPEDHWARSVLSFAVNRGWLKGDTNDDGSLTGSFRPDDHISRAETMAVLNRMLGRLPESEDDLLPGRIEWPDNQDKSAWYWIVVEEATNNHDHAMKSDGVHERWTKLVENIEE